jgi:hypothetical protein
MAGAKAGLAQGRNQIESEERTTIIIGRKQPGR